MFDILSATLNGYVYSQTKGSKFADDVGVFAKPSEGGPKLSIKG